MSRPCLPARALHAFVLAASLAAAACTADGAAPRDHAPPFDAAFRVEQRIRLNVPADRPIGSVSGLVFWNGRIALVDEIQAEVKLFDRAGRYHGALGGAGDGPGEFRMPFAALPLADGRLAVLDRRNGWLTWFDPSGAYAARRNTRVGVPSGMELAEDGKTLIVAGRYVPDSLRADSVSPDQVHLLAPDGGHLRSMLPMPAPVAPQETSFSGSVFARTGGVIAAGQHSRNEIRYHDLRTGREWSHPAGASFYRRPDWKRIANARTPAQVGPFAQETMWLSGVVDVGCGLVAAAFLVRENGEERFRYAVQDRAGGELFATQATGVSLVGVRDGALYATEMDADGNVELLRLGVNPAAAGRARTRGAGDGGCGAPAAAAP